jgi:protein-disulfide isomerase
LALGICVLGAAACRDSNASGSSAGPAASAENAAAVADVVLPGVDISPMTPRERREWSALATALFAPCPSVPVSVAQCVLEKRHCGMCLQSAKWIARAVRDGASEDQIQRAYKARFDPSTAKVIPIDGSPAKGPESAPVTVFEFADFECPHCREAVPMVDAMLTAYPDRVRFVYKSFTLPFHVHGGPAAKAAFAAGMQGKFWEMEHLLFERQQNLEAGDLERYAQMLKLDVARWKTDMDSAQVSARIAHDKELGESLNLKGTPTIYVDGREVDLEHEETIAGRVAAELGEPVDGPGASAAPSSSAASTAAPGAAPSSTVAPPSAASAAPSAAATIGARGPKGP